MKKKAIEKIPYLTLKKTSRKKDVKYIGVTAVKIVGHEKHLFLEVYRNEKMAKAVPVVRIVLTEKDLYEKIIDEAPVIGKMLILVFYGVYDVVVKANDGEELEDSEEVYSYIEVVVCPVNLQQEGLMYQEEKNTFGPVERKWIVKKPEISFIFPAFDHRSADEQEVIYFAENPLEPHHEIMEGTLGCHDIWTAAEHKQHLTKSIFTACDSEELTKEYIEGFNASLAGIIAQEEPETLNPEQFRRILELWMPKEYAQKVAEDYRNLYQDGYPEVELLYDEKAKDRHYAKKKHKKGLELLRISADAHKANGETDIANEIYEYLEGVR